MATNRYEYPLCWIRGSMDESDTEGDPVRQLVQRCPFRKGEGGWGLFGHKIDHKCTHPAVDTKDEVEGPREAYGGIVAGGLSDNYATFCPAVDLHLTSLGEPSRLIPEGSYTVIDQGPGDTRLLGPGNQPGE